MFLVEPPRTQYDINFGLVGVPVRVHPLFWLITVCLGASHDFVPAQKRFFADILIWTAAVFISILVHEFGHALLIRYYGWRPKIILYGLGGLASYEPTWHRTWPQVAISFAGPAAGFLLAAVVAVAVLLAGHKVRLITQSALPELDFDPFFRATGEPRTNLNLFVENMFFINVFWGLVNLLPIFPLDGGKISQEALNHFNPSNGVRLSLQVSIFAAAGMAIVAYLKLDSVVTAIFFACLAATNYQTLRQYNDGYGGRGW